MAIPGWTAAETVLDPRGTYATLPGQRDSRLSAAGVIPTLGGRFGFGGDSGLGAALDCDSGCLNDCRTKCNPWPLGKPCRRACRDKCCTANAFTRGGPWIA
jgi:hypothetical protein